MERKISVEQAYKIVNDIFQFVSKRGAHMFLLEQPLARDIKHKNKFENMASRICTETVYHSLVKNTLDYEVFLNKYKKIYFKDVALKNKNIFANCFEYNEDYINDISVANPELENCGNYFRNEDYKSNAINIKDGIRLDTDNVNDVKNKLCLFGNSAIFGYYVKDNETIAHYLQQKTSHYKVLNCATNGEILINLFNRISNFSICENDIVVIGMPPELLLEKINLFPVINTMDYFESEHEKENFVDEAHYTSFCHRALADIIFNTIEPIMSCNNDDNKYQLEIKQLMNEFNIEFENKNVKLSDEDVLGASVMSCNPFTIGHKYLVSLGSKMFDYFIVFLMQEGMELVYKKDDCSKLVRIGCSEFKNVIVVDMPKLFSYQTFWPEYNDLMLRHNENYIGLNTYKLLDVVRKAFVNLNIQHFVCGIEKDDNVTNQHFIQAKYLFGQYNINTIAIPRKKMKNGIKSISGHKVREFLEKQQLDELQGIVPTECLNYICSNNLVANKIQSHKKIMDIIEMNDRHNDNVDIQSLNLMVIDDKVDIINSFSDIYKLINYDDKEMLNKLYSSNNMAISVWAGYKYIMLYNDWNNEMFDFVYETLKSASAKENIKNKKEIKNGNS